jgi:hypothetical protein
MRLRSALCLLLLGCAACTQEASPTSPAVAVFNANPGAGDRLFNLVSITADNASHTIDGTLTAPYFLYIANALGPVQAIFEPQDVGSLEDVELLFGGETVPRIVSNPVDNSPGCPTPACSDTALCLCINSGEAPIPVPSSHEVRFDVTSEPIALFNGSVGGINENYLVQNGVPPATIWVEGVAEIAQGVFNKTIAGTTLTVTLYIDGVARTSASSGFGSTDSVVVQFELP